MASSSKACRRARPTTCCACAWTRPTELVPEITGHRLMVSVRLMRPDAEGRLRPVNEDVTLDLALCA